MGEKPEDYEEIRTAICESIQQFVTENSVSLLDELNREFDIRTAVAPQTLPGVIELGLYHGPLVTTALLQRLRDVLKGHSSWKIIIRGKSREQDLIITDDAFCLGLEVAILTEQILRVWYETNVKRQSGFSESAAQFAWVKNWLMKAEFESTALQSIARFSLFRGEPDRDAIWVLSNTPTRSLFIPLERSAKHGRCYRVRTSDRRILAISPAIRREVPEAWIEEWSIDNDCPCSIEFENRSDSGRVELTFQHVDVENE